MNAPLVTAVSSFWRAINMHLFWRLKVFKAPPAKNVCPSPTCQKCLASRLWTSSWNHHLNYELSLFTTSERCACHLINFNDDDTSSHVPKVGHVIAWCSGNLPGRSALSWYRPAWCAIFELRFLRRWCPWDVLQPQRAKSCGPFSGVALMRARLRCSVLVGNLWNRLHYWVDSFGNAGHNQEPNTIISEYCGEDHLKLDLFALHGASIRCRCYRVT